jgi:hypothetical protein
LSGSAIAASLWRAYGEHSLVDRAGIAFFIYRSDVENVYLNVSAGQLFESEQTGGTQSH